MLNSAVDTFECKIHENIYAYLCKLVLRSNERCWNGFMLRNLEFKVLGFEQTFLRDIFEFWLLGDTSRLAFLALLHFNMKDWKCESKQLFQMTHSLPKILQKFPKFINIIFHHQHITSSIQNSSTKFSH